MRGENEIEKEKKSVVRSDAIHGQGAAGQGRARPKRKEKKTKTNERESRKSTWT